MSYDVDIGPDSHNHSSNTAPLLRELIIIDEEKDHVGILHLHGMRGAEAAIHIEEALEKLEKILFYEGEDKIREKYDAKNKWGSVLTTSIFLGKLLNSCQKYPFDIVEVT